MSRLRSLVPALILGTATLGAAVALAGGRPFHVTLSGAAEVPGPGDPDGIGEATLTFNPGTQQVCFQISVSDITLPAIGAHIHEAAAGQSGPVVVALSPPDETGFSSGCATVDRDLVLEIMKSPESYYVNVHTTDFAAGALRGQVAE